SAGKMATPWRSPAIRSARTATFAAGRRADRQAPVPDRRGTAMTAINPPPAFIRPARFSAAEWDARVQLAAAYRIFDHLGWTELIYNHISLRVPDDHGHYLINPFGLH